MTAFDTLIMLASGIQPPSGLLHNCRFEGFGSESYGIEAIVARLRQLPFAIAPDADVVQTPDHIAVFDGDRAIFADLYDAAIGRLWLLGPDAGVDAEPCLAVPFDPDLDQAGGDGFLAAGDHPGLAAEAAARVTALGRAIARDGDGLRTRSFAIRAFGSAAAGAALFAVFRMRPENRDVAGFTLMAARWAGDDDHFVRDAGGEAMLAGSRWTPRFAP